MKYLPLGDIDVVNDALNFSTPDLHVIGGCDVYTTKAAGTDKKLYKSIEESLESSYQSLVRLSASLSPPYRTASDDGRLHGQSGHNHAHRGRRARTAEIPEIDLSRASPFGPLSQTSARRTFAYLIATLNASHPDYDFSHLLRPLDFHKTKSLRSIMQNVNSTLFNLRPRSQNSLALSNYLAPPLPTKANAPKFPVNSYGDQVWDTRMWTLVDKHMDLHKCEKYSYLPQDDPFDGEEGAIWSMHYFFFNKEKKRVCYLYLRGLSVISHSPVHAPIHAPRMARQQSSISIGEGAGKRAAYWLGGRVDASDIDSADYDDDDDDDSDMLLELPGDDEVDVPEMDLDEVRTKIGDGYYDCGVDMPRSWGRGWDEPLDDIVEMPASCEGSEARKGVRGVSEEVGEAMEM